MYLNRPTVLVLNKEAQIKFDKNFSKMIAKLIKQNICFEDVKKATDFVNNEYENLQDWWNKKMFKNVLTIFVSYIAKDLTI